MAEKQQLPEFVKMLVDLLATPKGQDIAKDFNTFAEKGSGAVEHVARTGERAFDLMERSGGDPRNMDPAEIGQTALEVGTVPLMGAVGGVPKNAAGQVVALEHGNPIKLGTMGAAAGGAGTAAYDWSQGDLKELDWDYILDRAGPNMLGGAALGFGTGVVGELLDEADWAKRQFKQRPTPKWNDLPASVSSPTPRVPRGPGGMSPQSAGPGSSAPPQQSGRGNTPAPQPSAPGSTPPSGVPTGSQSGGNQTMSGSSGGAPNQYTEDHTKAARVYLDNLFASTNTGGRTPAQISGDLQPYFRGVGLSNPPDTRERAAETLGMLRKLLPKDLSSTDTATVMRAVRQATGKAGTLGVAGAAMSNDDLEALLAEIMGGGR